MQKRNLTEWRVRLQQEGHGLYGPLYRALYKFTDRTIAEFFDDVPEMPPPMLSMERDRRGRAGFYTPLNGALLQHVINLNPFELRDGCEAAETIAHELIHHWQFHTTGSMPSEPHDEDFHQMMMGLYGISTHGSEGKHGGHDERWDEWLERNSDLSLHVFLLPGSNTPKPRRMKKHVCPECLVSFHCRTELNVRCGECGVLFVIESGRK